MGRQRGSRVDVILVDHVLTGAPFSSRLRVYLSARSGVVGGLLLWPLRPGQGDVEEGEDLPLGGGEAVEHRPVGGVGEGEVFEGDEDVACGGFGGSAFGQQSW